MRARIVHPAALRVPGELTGRLEAWAQAGLITRDQARAIAAHETRPAGPAGGPSVVVEALG